MMSSSIVSANAVEKLALPFCLLCLVGCTRIERPMVEKALPLEPPYAAWARVLERHVDGLGRVDFAGLAGDRADLNLFVAWVYDNGPKNHPERFPTRNHILAFHLNAYNALAMFKVLESGMPATLAGLRKMGFFYFGKVRVGGRAITLYDYENEVIRPLSEPRVHVALNCMAVSCPRLPREPFLPERLEGQLEREAKRFFNESRNVQVVETSKTLRLSEILEFYAGDFLAVAPSLAAYVNRYREKPVPENYKIEFIPYDWTINRQPGTQFGGFDDRKVDPAQLVRAVQREDSGANDPRGTFARRKLFHGYLAQGCRRRDSFAQRIHALRASMEIIGDR